nr:hypothetical protein Iba_chr12aCG9780 [Ipomoea batatas]
MLQPSKILHTPYTTAGNLTLSVQRLLDGKRDILVRNEIFSEPAPSPSSSSTTPPERENRDPKVPGTCYRRCCPISTVRPEERTPDEGRPRRLEECLSVLFPAFFLESMLPARKTQRKLHTKGLA